MAYAALSAPSLINRCGSPADPGGRLLPPGGSDEPGHQARGKQDLFRRGLVARLCPWPEAALSALPCCPPVSASCLAQSHLLQALQALSNCCRPRQPATCRTRCWSAPSPRCPWSSSVTLGELCAGLLQTVLPALGARVCHCCAVPFAPPCTDSLRSSWGALSWPRHALICMPPACVMCSYAKGLEDSAPSTRAG